MISLDVVRTVPGVPLTAGERFAGPWDNSPEHPGAQEQAPDITVARINTSRVRLQWSPASGGSAKSTVDLHVSARLASVATHYVIDWGDSSSDIQPGMNVKDLDFLLQHEYTFEAVTITVSAYNGATLIESQPVAVTPGITSWYAVDQFRVERFKGRFRYSEPARLWLPDWTPITSQAVDMDYYDEDARSGWNWGYRLWLRSLDDQGRPDLTMIPSNWVETGTGEGS